MTEKYITIAGKECVRLEVHLPAVGVWFADADMADEVDISGNVEIKIGSQERMMGHVSAQSGNFGLQTKLRIIGGNGAWGNHIPAKHYHNDAGLRNELIIGDAGREVGESVVTMEGASSRVGVDYARRSGPAVDVLHYLAPSGWRVGFDGKTYVGVASAAGSNKSSAELMKYDPRTQVAEYAGDSLDAVARGNLVTINKVQFHVRDLRVEITPHKFRFFAWLGGAETDESQAARALRSIVERITEQPLWGLYRYRVFAMNGAQRVDLQAISSANGLPSMLAVDMVPGASGWHAQLALGSEVYVQFADGDRSLPVVTGFPGKGKPGHVPVAVSICQGELPVARQGDMVLSGGPLTTVTFIGAAPMVPGTPYTMLFSTTAAPPPPPSPYLAGVVCSGNPVVKA